jgi:hypothetical protein
MQDSHFNLVDSFKLAIAIELAKAERWDDLRGKAHS